MDIRTKLALTLVSTALISMLALGSFAYLTAASLLKEVSERQLDALAESKRRDLENVIQGWRDRVNLISSRTQLRRLLDRVRQTGDTSVIPEIRRILNDALASVQNVERITLFDPDGTSVVTAGSADLPPAASSTAMSGHAGVQYSGTHPRSGELVLVRFHTSLSFEGRVIGTMEVVIDAVELVSVTENYTGLGETGEAMVFMADSTARVRSLTPLRHDPDLRLLPVDHSPYLREALAGIAALYPAGVDDYRGAEVWSATRSLPAVGWGLVVKIDAAEEAQRPNRLLDQMLDIGFSLGAFAILGGTLLGFRLGKPLTDLKDVVERIRGGEEDLRADVNSDDEVGFLSQALNELLDQQQTR